MSLTVLINRGLSDVRIVRWFRDPKFSFDYASRPILQMSPEEFRMRGYEWILHHFDEYARVRLSKSNTPKLLRPGEEKHLLQDRVAVWMKIDEPACLELIPQIFRKSTLVDTENLPEESRRKLPTDSPPEVFWKAFDEVLAAAIRADL